jgi:hypothetical protein
VITRGIAVWLVLGWDGASVVCECGKESHTHSLLLATIAVDEVELEALFEQFKALATSKNGIDKDTFERCLGPLGVETNLITDRIFTFFDQGAQLTSSEELRGIHTWSSSLTHPFAR